MKINYNIQNPKAVYLRPNGIDAPYELIDGNEFEVMDYFYTYDEALAGALALAKRSAYILYDCDGRDNIRGIYNLTKKHG